ncbi:MAG: hypothetical protein WA324_24890 [Bryobacteraceae bacterium]
MNKYEERSQHQHKSSMRVSVLMGVIGLVFAGFGLAAIGLIFAAPPGFWKVALLIIAVLMLVMRQAMRGLNKRKSKAAEPDPESILKLN